MKSKVLVMAAAAMLAACQPQVKVPAGDAISVVEVDEARIVQPAGGNTVTGATMTVRVAGAPVELVGVSSPIAEKVEIHEMAMEGDVMRMRKIDALDVTEAAPLVMEGGGTHLMVFGLKAPLVEGESVDILLELRDASGETMRVVAEADVVPPGG